MRLARINTLLFLGIILINLYIIVMPFIPSIVFRVQQHRGVTKQLQKTLSMPEVSSISTAGNRLIVPAMLLDAPINEGSQNAGLSKGLWHIPSTSTPNEGGNTVIIGHRFTYTNPEGVFYNLNKVQIGDEIGVFWQGRRYLYSVSKTEVVSPNDVAIQAPTSKPQITLYTCTPLWFPKNRLIVIARELTS